MCPLYSGLPSPVLFDELYIDVDYVNLMVKATRDEDKGEDDMMCKECARAMTNAIARREGCARRAKDSRNALSCSRLSPSLLLNPEPFQLDRRGSLAGITFHFSLNFHHFSHHKVFFFLSCSFVLTFGLVVLSPSPSVGFDRTSFSPYPSAKVIESTHAHPQHVCLRPGWQ